MVCPDPGGVDGDDVVDWIERTGVDMEVMVCCRRQADNINAWRMAVIDIKWNALDTEHDACRGGGRRDGNE